MKDESFSISEFLRAECVLPSDSLIKATTAFLMIGT
jgi:hypothetical protein